MIENRRSRIQDGSFSCFSGEWGAIIPRMGVATSKEVCLYERGVEQKLVTVAEE